MGFPPILWGNGDKMAMPLPQSLHPLIAKSLLLLRTPQPGVQSVQHESFEWLGTLWVLYPKKYLWITTTHGEYEGTQAAVALNFSWQFKVAPGKKPETDRQGPSCCCLGRKSVYQVCHFTLQLLCEHWGAGKTWSLAKPRSKYRNHSTTPRIFLWWSGILLISEFCLSGTS